MLNSSSQRLGSAFGSKVVLEFEALVLESCLPCAVLAAGEADALSPCIIDDCDSLLACYSVDCFRTSSPEQSKYLEQDGVKVQKTTDAG